MKKGAESIRRKLNGVFWLDLLRSLAQAKAVMESKRSARNLNL
jgi:hypothetical protein